MKVQCTLRKKDNELFLTTKPEYLKCNDEVWAFNAKKFAKDTNHYLTLERYYEPGKILRVYQSSATDCGYPLVDIQFNETEIGLAFKLTAIEKIILKGDIIKQFLTPFLISTIINGKKGICYIDYQKFPKKIYLEPKEEADFPQETAVLEQRYREEASDEALHSQYDLYG